MMAKLKMDCSRELLLKPKDLAIAHNELVAKISMLDSSEEIAKKKIDFPRAQTLMESGELENMSMITELTASLSLEASMISTGRESY